MRLRKVNADALIADLNLLTVVSQLPDSMNFGEIVAVLSTLYARKYSLLDQGAMENRPDMEEAVSQHA
jgi:hypothetical protein